MRSSGYNDSAAIASRVAGSVPYLWVALVCLLLLVLPANIFGQGTTGTLRGQVLDPAGAVVAGAQVAATNDATQVAQTSVTTSSGTYSFPNVLPGTYAVTIEAKGFKKYVTKGVVVVSN